MEFDSDWEPDEATVIVGQGVVAVVGECHALAAAEGQAWEMPGIGTGLRVEPGKAQGLRGGKRSVD